MSKAFTIVGLVLTSSIVAFGCSASTDQTDSTDSEDLKGQECGGFVANPKSCPSGYECIADGSHPDAPGHCKKEKSSGCTQNVICAISEHFDTSECKCVENNHEGPTCVTLTCESGYHCEEKGINGGEVATCIKN
jgi:hypothetical protein